MQTTARILTRSAGINSGRLARPVRDTRDLTFPRPSSPGRRTLACLNARASYQRKRLNVINAPATDSAPQVLAYTCGANHRGNASRGERAPTGWLGRVRGRRASRGVSAVCVGLESGARVAWWARHTISQGWSKGEGACAGRVCRARVQGACAGQGAPSGW